MIVLSPCKCYLLLVMNSNCNYSSFEASEVSSLRSQDDRVNVNFMPFLQKNWAERFMLLHCGLVLVINLIPLTYQTSTIAILSGPIMTLERASYVLALRFLVPLLSLAHL